MKQFLHWLPHPERWAYLSSLCYAMLYPGTLFVIVTNQIPPDGAVFAGVLICLQGISIALWLWNGLKHTSLLLVGGIFIGAFVIEYIGATYDVPFGAYDYTTELGWRLADTVPVVILFAWLLASVGTWLVAYLLAPQAAPWVRVGIAGICIVLFDLQIEPVATLVQRYWVWHDHGRYYGVPVMNFAGWLLTGMAFAWATDHLLLRRIHSNTRTTLLPLFHLILCMGMFLVMNFHAGHRIAAAISCVCMVTCVLLYPRWIVLTHAHRHQFGNRVTPVD